MKILESLRVKLHNCAEISGEEKNTNRIINKFLEKTHPDFHYRNVGGYGIVVVYKGEKEGKNILVRADIDGLNIPEGDRQYSHRCGHDGHATILCGLALRYGRKRPKKGDIILLFQPAEETGEGAQAVINGPIFQQLKIDTAFALHNLPGFAKHQIVVKEGCFAAASQGLKLIFDGSTSHASQPEKGNNPQVIIPILLDAFQRKYENLKSNKFRSTLTVTHVSLGEKTFGVTPGHAEIWLTLRSENNNELNTLTNSTIDLCRYIAKEYKLQFSYSINEAFTATINSRKEVEVVNNAAQKLKLSVMRIKNPFPWSEDFGRFGELYPSCLFGLGCGFEHEVLHSPLYNFEDEIIDTGINIFEKIVEDYNNTDI